MNSYTFTELSNRKIFPKSGIFNSLDGDFYLINSATLYLSYTWSEIGGINFVERDESAANQSSSLFWAEQELSQRDKKSFSFTMIGLTLQCTTAFWLCFYWQTSETYEKNILAILQYCMIFWHHTWLSCHYLSIPEEKKSNHWLISEKSWIEYKFSVANYIHIRVNY